MQPLPRGKEYRRIQELEYEVECYREELLKMRSN